MHEALSAQIQRLIDLDRLDLARQKISDSLGQYPDWDELYALQANLSIKEKKYEEAMEAIQQAIVLDPENSHHFFTKSRIHYDKKDLKRAHQEIDRALSLDPNFAPYYGFKAAIFLETKKYEEVISWAREGLAVDPSDLMCNNVLTLALNQTGESDEAYERLEHMLEDDPNNVLTQANTGFHFLRKGNIPKAKEHFAEALRQDPNFEFARAGMMESIKASNWFYRKLLQYSFWVEKIGNRNRWVFLIGLLILIRIIPVLIPFYLIFLFWTWFTGPLSNLVLYFDRYGKFLMEGDTRKSTQINIALLGTALLSGIAAVWDASFLVLSFALFVSIIPVYLAGNSDKKRSKWALGGFATYFTATGIVSVLLSTQGLPFGQAFFALMLGIVIFSWTASLFE